MKKYLALIFLLTATIFVAGYTLDGVPSTSVVTAGVSITNAPDVLTSASTVTVTSANSPYIALTLTNNVTKFTITAGGFPTNLVGGFTLDLFVGAYSFGFDTTVITNSTLLDISTNNATSLFFRKPYGSTWWRVRQ